MATRRPSLPPMPDLSHLTEDERKIIEDVLRRQREEEDRETEMIRQMQDEFDNYQQSVKKLGEETKKLTTTDSGAVCEICCKTKFADGVGHKCNYCGLRSCARCGGRISLRGNKTIWACNLCRKKLEIKAKTGAWYHGGMAKPVALDVGDTTSECETASTKTDITPPTEKRPKMLEKKTGDGSQGSEKENIEVRHDGKPAVTRTGSLQGRELKRQYSMTEQGTPKNVDNNNDRTLAEKSLPQHGHRDSDKLRDRGHVSDSGRHSDRDRHHSDRHSGSRSSVEGSEKSHRGDRERHRSRRLQEGHGDQTNTEGAEREQSADRYAEERELRHARRQGLSPSERYTEREEKRERRRDPSRDRRDSRESMSSRGGYPEEGERAERRREPSRERFHERNLENQPDYAASREHHNAEPYTSPSHGNKTERELRHAERAIAESSNQSVDRKGSSRHRHSSKDGKDQRSTGHDRGERTERTEHSERLRDRTVNAHQENYDQFANSRGSPAGSKHYIRVDHVEDLHRDDSEHFADRSKQHLDPSSAATKNSRSSRRKVEAMIIRNDSLSSDPSDCVRPPPPKPHKHRRGKKQRQHSLSSSDDEIRSTPECSSCEEGDLESESVSEKGEIESNGLETRLPAAGRHEDRQSKLVRFGRGEGRSMEEDSGWSEPIIKDSGIDTGFSSSSQTLNEEHLKHPVTWQLSTDGKRWIGHMILKKAVLEGAGPKDSSAILGLKVIGGRRSETSSKLGAFITKVKKGSIADTVGHLRSGDEVVEWNGRSLQGATFEEVYEIILESKQEPQVELIVHRSARHGEVPPTVTTDHAKENLNYSYRVNMSKILYRLIRDHDRV